MEFRLLGPLEVAGDGEFRIEAHKPRSVLALLLLNANQVVSADRLIDALWNGSPPRSAAKLLQTYVSQLRRELGSERILTKKSGYLAVLAPGELDIDEFERLRRAQRPREALEVWRGDALADFAYETWAQPEIARLTEARMTALEDHFELELASGKDRECLSELEATVEQNPFRERLAGQLMLALYRSGQQTAALEVYAQLRRHLDDGFGLQPGEDLRRLQQAILRQDPTLRRPAEPVDRASDTPLPRARVMRRRWGFASAGLITLAAAGATVAVLAGTDSAHAIRGIDANSVAMVDPRNARIVTEVPVDEPSPTVATSGAGSLWVSSTDANVVFRIDPGTRQLRDTINVGDGPVGIAFAKGDVWVANSLDDTVSRIDPSVGRAVQTIRVGDAPTGIAATRMSLWVANSGDDTLSKIDPSSGTVAATLAIGVPARAVVVAGAGLWVTDDVSGSIVRIDPHSGATTASVTLGATPTSLLYAFGSLWAASASDGTVTRVDPIAERVIATIDAGNAPDQLAAAGGAIWVTDEFGQTIDRIDPDTNRITKKLPTLGRATALVPVGRFLWAAVGVTPATHRGGTLRVVDSFVPFDTLDPSVAYLPSTWQILSMTNDGLTGFDRVDGADSASVVPDIAISLPQPTDGGLVYRFRLRRGIRYSTGELVRPGDFRRAIERTLVLNSPGESYYRNIVGATRCVHDGSRCSMAAGVVTDDAANTLTFRLLKPDPEFLEKLALPFAFAVPAATPLERQARPLPATGPYVVTRYDQRRGLTLVRNRFFREWSQAAQPDGYPDTISWRTSIDPTLATNLVERGKADLLYIGPLKNRVAELETRFPHQFYVNPQIETYYLFMNTRMPPFNDIRVRRAVNYAVNRRAFVRVLGPTVAQLTCQVLPRFFAGWKAYCPYTRDPNRAGTWIAPDLARAKRLVRLSGTAGMRVTAWFPDTQVPALASAVRSLLTSLGYRATIKVLPLARFVGAVRDSRTRAQIGIDGWIADYPTPSNVILPTLSCVALRTDTPANTNEARFCDRRIDAKMRTALQEEASDPNEANRIWAHIDRELVDRAPWAPVYNLKWSDFVSHRVGNHEYSLEWHTLVDQLWVR